MKVLWIVNSIFPYPAEQLGINKSCFGGWLYSLYQSLNKNNKISFVIVSTARINKMKKYCENNTTYYVLPNRNEDKYNRKLEKYYKIILEENSPDVIHIHGTEYPKALPLLRKNPNLNYVVSIQGMINPYMRVTYANLSFFLLLKNITVRDILKPSTGILIKRSMKKRMAYEKEIISNVSNIIGRTDWDKAQTLALNPNIKYYIGEENLREEFYSDNWNIEKINRHTIFISQAQSIIKGFYIMIEALKILKIKYNDVKVVVAGNNLFDSTSIKSKLKRQSYTKYLYKLAKKYDLLDNIEFTGYLDAEAYKNKLIHSNVYVQTSSIENSSNALAEAMILGVPCVASNVGGTSTMLEDKEEGFLYPYTEPELLAFYISKFFDDDKLCIDAGKKASKHARKRHNWENNSHQVYNIYKSIIKKGTDNEKN